MSETQETHRSAIEGSGHENPPYKKKASVDEVKINVSINSQYKVFDKSGSLPFTILFALTRRLRDDSSDGMPLLFETSKSVFDVPYALKHGLLRLLEDERDSKVTEREDFDPPPAESRIYALYPKPKGHRTKVFQQYTYHVDVSSPMAKLFQPKKKYTIRLKPNGKLGVKWWAYGDTSELLVDGKPNQPSESAKLAARPTGKASFTAVETLSKPPSVEGPSDPSIEVSVINRTDQTFSVQSTGHQKYICSWGPYEPDIDDRFRITDTESTGRTNFTLTNTDTGDVTHVYKPPGCLGVTNGKVDLRPRRKNFTSLEPDKPFTKTLNVDNIVKNLKLPDGTYKLELQTLGAWWSWGSLDDIFSSSDGDERIARERWKGHVLPVELACTDQIQIVVSNNQCTSCTG